jgi:nucleotide-binding universal stress UspA family protein
MVVVDAAHPAARTGEAHDLARSVGCELDEVHVVESPVASRPLAALTGDRGTLLCMASHGRSPFGELLLGSVSAEVARTAANPLILVGPQAPLTRPAPFRTLLVGLDDTALCHSAVLPEAVRWAKLGLHPWLVQVVESSARRDGRTAGEAALVRDAATTLREGGIDSELEVLYDHNPAHAIVQFGNQLPSPIALVATHGRTGLRHFTMGSVTLSLVHHAPWPVIVVPPVAVEPLAPLADVAGYREPQPSAWPALASPRRADAARHDISV